MERENIWSREAKPKLFSIFRSLFSQSVLTTSASCNVTLLKQIHICSPYQLSSTYPIVVIRKMRLSRFASRLAASLHCQDRSLFRSSDSPSDMGGSLVLQSRRTTICATSCRTGFNYILGSKSPQESQSNSVVVLFTNLWW